MDQTIEIIEEVFITLEALTDNLLLVSDGLRYSSDDNSAANAVMVIANMQKDICDKLNTTIHDKEMASP